MAAKLLAIKLWFDPGTTRIRADRFNQGRGHVADFFMRPPTLTASNFAALWPTDLYIKCIERSKPILKIYQYFIDWEDGLFCSKLWIDVSLFGYSRKFENMWDESKQKDLQDICVLMFC